MNEEQLKKLISQVLKEVDIETDVSNSGSSAMCINGMIPDVREEDYTLVLDVENPANPEDFLRIKAKTDARLGIGRCGSRYKTKSHLRILADRAGALDAVLNEIPQALIEDNHLLAVQTLCDDRGTYLRRPDLGRQFSEEMKNKIQVSCVMNPDVQVIASEGLSSTALERNIADLLPSLEQGFQVEGIQSGTPIYVRYSRVPAMDVITELTKAKVTIMLIGERPGLSTYASLSAYMTYEGKVGMPEMGRTVISNIHAGGTNPTEAGAHIAGVVRKMLDQKASGTELKL